MIAPVKLRFLTKFQYLRPTRLSKICTPPHGHLAIPAGPQASKLYFRRSVLATKADAQPAPKKLKFLKELPGRLVSARGEGSHQVLLPFLNGVANHYSTVETLRTIISPAR